MPVVRRDVLEQVLEAGSVEEMLPPTAAELLAVIDADFESRIEIGFAFGILSRLPTIAATV